MFTGGLALEISPVWPPQIDTQTEQNLQMMQPKVVMETACAPMETDEDAVVTRPSPVVKAQHQGT